ncbi:hypothetical protein D0T49_05235 [Paludibacter sp. 221]|nr:hypothetical protein [Paludibacter sp. 221]
MAFGGKGYDSTKDHSIYMEIDIYINKQKACVYTCTYSSNRKYTTKQNNRTKQKIIQGSCY